MRGRWGLTYFTKHNALHVWHVSGLHSRLWQNDLLLHGINTFFSSMCLMMDTHVVSTFWGIRYNVVMIIHAQVPMRTHVFISLR